MSLYTTQILPQVMNWVMTGEPFQSYRRQLLAEATGQVLEIGFGTGLNLGYYPSAVTTLTTVDINPGMAHLARRRLGTAPFPVDMQILSGEHLPMATASFDCVVSTWTLCSIAQVDQAIAEVHRVLKPGGRFLFIEHGLSPDPSIQRWQHRLTPLQRAIADGCHLNRPIQSLVGATFSDLQISTFYAPNLPRVAGYMYRGIATKAPIVMD